MSKIAFIYPGQGAQKAGMGQDFYENSKSAKAVFDKASEILGLDMNALCFEENDKLDLTEYTQAALVTTCLAMTKVVREKGIHPDVTAGLSLGEYCAIAEAKAMSEEDAIRTVRKRGILMQNTVPAGEGAMAAVLGMEAEVIENVIAPIEVVTIANYNCPGQIVITGVTAGVEQAAEELKTAGAKRLVMLNVSGPENEDEIKELLGKQVSSSVRWEQSIRKMIEEGVDTFVEIGPGKTLAGFMRKISRDVSMYNIGTWEDVDKVAEALK